VGIVTTDKPDERRRAPRVDTSIKATVTSGKRTVPFVIDSLSTSGARLIGPLALAMKEKVGIVFTADEHRLEVTAEVVRVDTADLMTDQIAVRFLDPTAETAAVLRVLVERTLDQFWSSDGEDAERPAPDAETTGPSTRVAPDDEDTELVIEPDE
jgi:hypothetical protein